MAATRKPILGVLGGIGSGKSSVARFIAEQFSGALFNADEQAKTLLDDEQVKQRIRQWWGEGLFDGAGRVDRRKLATKIFADEADRKKLEGMIHPKVAELRDAFIEAGQRDAGVKLIVLDVPLLAEVGLAQRCDRLIFVACDRPTRLDRLKASRGWDQTELVQREKNQWPLDRKLNLAHDVVDNSGRQTTCLAQARSAVEHFLKKFP